MKNILMAISGPSGVGKGTLVKALLAEREDVTVSVSCTTRPPRAGERDGKEYFFLTRAEFERRIAEDDFLEYDEHFGNYYGTPKAYVEQQLAAGKDVILEIEIQGALKVKKKFPDTLLLFVTPPSVDVLRERLIGRGTEDAETVKKRLGRAIEEADGVEEYDYLVVNDDLDTCVEEVHSIIQAEKLRVSRNINFINEIKSELKGE